MATRQLAPGASLDIPEEGMMEIRVLSVGSSTPIRLDLSGDGLYNRMNNSAFKLLKCEGEIEIRIQPVENADFSNTISGTVQVVKGRRGAGSEDIYEFQNVPLSDATSVRIGTIAPFNRGGTQMLTLTSATGFSKKNVEGLAAVVKAKLRTLIDEGQIVLPRNLNVVVALDNGAAMSTPALRHHVSDAVNIISGTVAACTDTDNVYLQWGRNHSERVALGQLENRIQESIDQGAKYIGGSEYVGDGLRDLTFVISDVAPALIDSGNSNAIALVLGNNPVDIPIEGSTGALVNVDDSFASRVNDPLNLSGAQRNPLKVVSTALENLAQQKLPTPSRPRTVRGSAQTVSRGPEVPSMPTWEGFESPAPSAPQAAPQFEAPTVAAPSFAPPTMPAQPSAPQPPSAPPSAPPADPWGQPPSGSGQGTDQGNGQDDNSRQTFGWGN